MRATWLLSALAFAACAPPAGSSRVDAIAIGGDTSDDGGATYEPPTSFTPADIGAYERGVALAVDATFGPGSGPKICNVISGVVRDFKGALAAAGGALEPGGHPDFEVFEGRGSTHGLVAPELGADHKPIYTSRCERGAPVSATCPFGAMTTSKAAFDQWYRSVDGVNKPFLVYLQLEPGAGVSTFKSSHFFPMDGAGWGDSGKAGDVWHNFGFTTEIHTTFRYGGGERFNFQGDDDVWIFINGKLAVDLGGLHTADTGAGLVDLDASAAALGITKGNVYPLDLFHAERHSIDSNFRIDMNLAFEDCGYVVP
ncbi:MAG TPA: fibro-slime domain-containing protein [Polyangia bacterium]|nr:fibro-slime domain-containing protein [Polyangia bacterium]